MTGTPQSTRYVFDQQTRILVVDDDPIVREFASVYLTTPLSEIVLAPGGSTALDILAREQFDLAMLDVDMPGMSGYELLEYIRGQHKLRDLPIVMVTGHEDILSIDRAYALGATSFTTKPVNWRQLSYQLQYVIRASKQHSGAPLTQERRSHRGGASSWMTTGKRREFATEVGTIINAAKRILNGRAPNGEAAQAIIAAAESLLLKSVLNQDEADPRGLTLPRPTQQPLPQAS
jgi:two-component system, sensor histidine kinase and response regulator